MRLEEDVEVVTFFRIEQATLSAQHGTEAKAYVGCDARDRDERERLEPERRKRRAAAQARDIDTIALAVA